MVNKELGMATKPRTREIMSLFQKSLKTQDKSLIQDISLEELENANTDLGWRDKDSSWRLAIQKRILELNQNEKKRITEQDQEKQEIKAKTRHSQNLWLGGLSILIAVIIALLGWFYFK